MAKIVRVKSKQEEYPVVNEGIVTEDSIQFADDVETIEGVLEDLEEANNVSLQKLERAVEVIQNMFNLNTGTFVVSGFSDKGHKCQLSFHSPDFDVTVLVKDSEKYGINQD